MKNYTKIIFGLAAFGLVTACGEGATTTALPVLPPDSGSQPLATSTEDVTGKLLADGQTLEGLEVAALTLNYDDGNTGIADEATVKIRRNDAGEITATINGTEFAFATADRQVEDDGNIYAYSKQDAQGRDVNLWTASGGELDALLDENGTGYMRVLGGQTNAVDGDETEPNLRFMTLVGAMTPADTLPALASANYEGQIRMDAYPETGFVDNETSRERLRGDLAMTADFTAGSISGMASNLEVEAPGDSDYSSVAGSLLFNNGAISGNTFGGQLSADNAFLAESGGTLSGTYKGGFFGPNGEQLGTVMSVSGSSSTGENFNANGFGEARKQ